MSTDKVNNNNTSLSNEEILALIHQEYLSIISESGVPLWVLDYYKGVEEPRLLKNDNND